MIFELAQILAAVYMEAERSKEKKQRLFWFQTERPRQKATSLIMASQRSMNFWQEFLLNSKNQITHYIQYLSFLKNI